MVYDVFEYTVTLLYSTTVLLYAYTLFEYTVLYVVQYII